MTKIDTITAKKKVVYVCWNDMVHASGTYMWDSLPLQQDTVACPVCGEVVRITQKL
jgi:hypothetical protein